MLHRNGAPPAHHPTKHTAAASVRSEFPPERPIDSAHAVAYLLSRLQVGGVPVRRWLAWLLGAAGLLALLRPGGGVPYALLALVLLGAFWLWQWAAQRRGYVRFSALAVAPPHPLPLEPATKLPVYVSGLLAVGNKVRRFAGLPGFYRTFGTREHALLCQVRPRRLAGLAAWPEEEKGLWYAFFAGAEIHAVHPGLIAFDRQSLRGFALDYTPAQPLGGKGRRRPQRLTLYVAFTQEADFYAALADLAVEPLATIQEKRSQR